MEEKREDRRGSSVFVMTQRDFLADGSGGGSSVNTVVEISYRKQHCEEILTEESVDVEWGVVGGRWRWCPAGVRWMEVV